METLKLEIVVFDVSEIKIFIVLNYKWAIKMSEKVKKSPSKTAEEVTLIRMGESQKGEDERICYDPLAIHFISRETLELHQKNPEIAKEKEVLFRGVANTIAARVRYFDDFVKKFLSERGFSNIVDVTSEDYKKAYFNGKNKDREVFSLMSFAHAVVE